MSHIENPIKPDKLPCIISVAITGSLPSKRDNPAVPITVEEQIESTHEAFEAGASLVHLHVRNPDGTPTSSPESFARVQAGIRRHCPGMIVQFSTGGRSGSGRERGAHLTLRPDMASLATGSVNFPTRVYDNSPDLVDWLAEAMREQQVKPEIEAFDLSMIFQAARMQREGLIEGALHVQFVMGIRNAMPADPDVLAFYVQTLQRLSPGATWTGAGIGREQLPLARWSLALGGHCRTGLEDNVRLDRETLAPSNAALVRQVVQLCEEFERPVAGAAQARAILGLSAA
jgi:3-keto-5-aminohexanoate cleavage enzyme